MNTKRKEVFFAHFIHLVHGSKTTIKQEKFPDEEADENRVITDIRTDRHRVVGKPCNGRHGSDVTQGSDLIHIYRSVHPERCCEVAEYQRHIALGLSYHLRLRPTFGLQLHR